MASVSEVSLLYFNLNLFYNKNSNKNSESSLSNKILEITAKL